MIAQRYVFVAPVRPFVTLNEPSSLALSFSQCGLQALYFLLGIRDGTRKCLFALCHLLFLAASRTEERALLNQASLQHTQRLLGLSDNLSS